MRLARRLSVALVALVTSAALGSPAGAGPVDPRLPAPGVHVDPQLLARAAHGPVPALLSWDRARASRGEVTAYLREQGVRAHVFERLAGAVTCDATRHDVLAMAGAPGALSVWGDEPLRPTLSESVRTAFRGSPSGVWDGLGVTGKGVGIAVLDTGVNGLHRDLEWGRRLKQNVRVVLSTEDILGPANDPCAIADQYSEQLPNTEISSGHGTHLASVAAGDGGMSNAVYRGVAPGADVVGVGVADTVTPQVRDGPSISGGGQPTELSLLGAIAGINYVLLNSMEGRVKVILAGWVQEGVHPPYHPMSLTIRDTFYFGMNIVFPVGNSGPGPSDCSAAATCHFNAWAAEPEAIAVAATPKRSRTLLEPYSSRGDPVPRESGDQVFLYEPTLAAPGTGVVAARSPGFAPYAQPPGSILGGRPELSAVGTDARYVALTGTSVAAAHVAGAIALMQQAAVREKGCFLTSWQVRDILVATATPMAGYARSEAGAGALDVTAAVLAALRAPVVGTSGPWMCPGPQDFT